MKVNAFLFFFSSPTAAVRTGDSVGVSRRQRRVGGTKVKMAGLCSKETKVRGKWHSFTAYYGAMGGLGEDGKVYVYSTSRVLSLGGG